jgi:hypothetical protein
MVNLSKGNAPKEIYLKLRLALDKRIASVTVNGRHVQLAGTHDDTVAVATGDERVFEVIARLV